MADPEFGYVKGQARASFAPLLEKFTKQSEAAAARPDVQLDIIYGRHPRQRFDWLPATRQPLLGTLVYFHAGYWQSRDKATFRFIAESFNCSGLHVALVNYPLCPEATLPQLVAAAHQALDPVRAKASTLPLVLSGHSAGAHIAVELALLEQVTGKALAGVAGLSGVYDLRDLVGTSLNDKLRLDDAAARAASPILRVPAGLPLALFAVGEEETLEFRDQNRHMADAWRDAGNSCTELVCAEKDHFSILTNFTDPRDPLHIAVARLAREAKPSGRQSVKQSARHPSAP